MNFEIIRNDAFENLFLTYHARLVNYARRFVSINAEAEDLIQEVFIKYWDKYSSRLDNDAPRLLFAMTRNSCLDYLKKKRPSFINALSSSDPIGEELLYNWDFNFDSAEQKYLIDELNSQVRGVLDTLPSRCRQVFEMSRFQGLTNREISEKLQISHTAVEKHIKRALSSFEKSLKENNNLLFCIFVMSMMRNFCS